MALQALAQHGIKLDFMQGKELLHSIPKGEEWQGQEGKDSILFNLYLSVHVLKWGSIGWGLDTSVSCKPRVRLRSFDH